MKVIGDKLFIREITEEVTKAGIIIDEKKPDRIRKGVIEYIGEEASEELEVGDTVYFNHYITKKIDMNGKEFYVMTSGDIVAKIHK